MIAVSDGERRRLRRVLVPDAKIVVVYNAIDAEKLEATIPNDLRQRFGFPKDSIVCVSAGRFSREKGQIYFWRAVQIAVVMNPRLRAVMFGDGNEREGIKTMIQASGLDHAVKCPGFEGSLGSMLAGADLVVNSSLSEELPNVLLEAMALKKPVVATAVGGVCELVEEGVTGYLVPAADPVGLAEKILDLAADRATAQRLGNAAHERVKMLFSPEMQEALLYEAYLRARQAAA